MVLEAGGGEHRMDDELPVLERRQLDEPDAVRVLASGLSTGSERELRLADAAGTGEGQQPRRRQRALEVGETLAAAYETCQFQWQVAGMQGCSGGRQGHRSLDLRWPRGKADAWHASDGAMKR